MVRRLERRGWLAAEWGETDTGRDARFYQLTAAGNERLGEELGTWRRYVAAMTRVLDAAAPVAGS